MTLSVKATRKMDCLLVATTLFLRLAHKHSITWVVAIFLIAHATTATITATYTAILIYQINLDGWVVVEILCAQASKII